MLSRRRPLLWGLALALIIAGTVLAVATLAKGGASGAGETPPGKAPAGNGALATAAADAVLPPGEPLLRAQNLEYAPELDAFRVEDFLHSIDSPLADYAVAQGGRETSIAQLVGEAARRHAVNPRVLLVLMELSTRIVSAPTPEGVMRAAGYPVEVAPDAAAQIERLAATLSSHYVAASMGDAPMAVRTPGDELVRLDDADPVRLALAQTLGETVVLAELRTALVDAQPRFGQVYRAWFGDPLEMPIFAQGVVLPEGASWPYEGAKRHTSGPHVGSFCSQQDVQASSGLDWGGEAHEVLVMADGRYLGRGETTAAGYQAGKYALFEHAGGIQVMFWHLGGFTPELLALAPGSDVPKGFPVGWSGRSGNQSAVHLHVELRRGAVAANPYSGVRVSWDGQVVDGWTVRMFRWPGRSDLGISYRGSATRGAARLLALDNCECDQPNAEAFVSAQHPGTAAPRNGMDANTVLANYPDVGLLPSSNVRTTQSASAHEKAWRVRVPWYYLIVAVDGVSEAVLDGAPAWEESRCGRALWLGAGEHRLTWRQRDEGTGAPAVSVAAWPFALPECAAPSTEPAPERAQPPAGGYDDAVWISGDPAGHRVEGGAGERVVVSWRLTNTGTRAWDDKDTVTFGDGYPFDAPWAMALPTAAPGESITVTLPITAPSEPGEYHSTWRLRHNGAAFGPVLSAQVTSRATVQAATGVESAAGAALSGPDLIYPADADGIAYVNTRDVTLRWSAVAGAEGYDLFLSLLPDPMSDPAPVYRERLGAGVGERRLILGSDIALLYWQVVAIGGGHDSASRVGAFGADTAPPTCALSAQADDEGRAWVAWDGGDVGSGISVFEVAYRRGEYGAWNALAILSGDAARETLLAARTSGTYALRCRARDEAGNEGAWSAPETAIAVGRSDAAPASVPPVLALAATARADGMLLVEAPVAAGGSGAGDVELGLWVSRGGAPEPGAPTSTWDLAGGVVSGVVTLTAVIAPPVPPARVGAALDHEVRLAVRASGAGAAAPSASTTLCVASPDPYEVWELGGGWDGAWLLPGGRQTRGLHGFLDVDSARVAARAGQQYVVWTEGLGPAADTVLELYDVAGAAVAVSDDAGGFGSRLAWTPPEDGNYRVVVRAWAAGTEGCGAGYTLRLQTDPPAPEIAEAVGGAVMLPLVTGD